MTEALLVLLGSGRSWRRRQPWAWGLATGSLALLALMVHWPVLAQALALAPLPAQAWLVALVLCVGCVQGLGMAGAAARRLRPR